MKVTRRELLDNALNLPPSDRASLVREIISSLDGPADQGVDEAWAKEIERRVREVADGTVQPVAWDEVRKRLRARLSPGS